MIQSPVFKPSVRYIDSVQAKRDLEAFKQMEAIPKGSPSFFLKHGFTGKTKTVAPVKNLYPLVVPKSAVARKSAYRLSIEADIAKEAITKELKPFGFRVISGGKEITRPFADKRLIHLCETTVCYIPYNSGNGRGRLVVKMTNFASGTAVPTNDGIKYKDVIPMRDTSKEKNMFRLIGIVTDDNGEFIKIDPNFTRNGMAWNVDSHKAITDACKRTILR